MTLAPPAGYLSPAVRALARLHAFEPAGIAGSGARDRVTLADVLASLALAEPVPAEPSWAADGLIETTVDVTADGRDDVEIAAGVRRAAHAIRIGHEVLVSLAGPGVTRLVPPLPAGQRVAVAAGAPRWTAVSALTATGERVVTSRLQRTIVVRWSAREWRQAAESLLSAAAAAVDRGTH